MNDNVGNMPIDIYQDYLLDTYDIDFSWYMMFVHNGCGNNNGQGKGDCNGFAHGLGYGNTNDYGNGYNINRGNGYGYREAEEPIGNSFGQLLMKPHVGDG